MPGATMPIYRCHKLVRAAKISRILGQDGESGPDAAVYLHFAPVSIPVCGYMTALETAATSETPMPHEMAFTVHTIEPFSVTNEWITRHRPQVGGYFVCYQDGYSSYSPAEAFENGYAMER